MSSIGEEDKYNVTLTIAAIKAVHHFILKSEANRFDAFIQVFPRLKSNFKDLMNQHYGIDIYNSTEAKHQFLAPDLLPFD